MGHHLFGPHTPFFTLNVENKYSVHISVTYSRYVTSMIEIHHVVSEESHRTDGTHEYYTPPATLAGGIKIEKLTLSQRRDQSKCS